MRKMIAMFAIVTALFHVTSCGSDGGSDDVPAAATKYSVKGSMTIDAGMPLTAADKVVSFTLTWSENGNDLTGTYEDDYFATAPAPVEGKLSSTGERTFTVKLAAPAHGVSTIEMIMPKMTTASQTTGEITLSKITAKNADGSVVFEKENVTVKSVDGVNLPPPPVTATGSDSAAAFFAQIKGTYKWYATNVEATTTAKYEDATFKHGSLYTVTISDQAAENAEGATTDIIGSIKFEFEETVKAYNFGKEVLFQKVDHEQYSKLQEATYSVNIQHVFEGDVKFATYAPNDGNKAFWKFSVDEPAALVEPLTGLAKYGITHIVGTHKFEISGGNDCKLYTLGEKIDVTIADDGAVTAAGKFGTFPAADLSISSNSSTAMWCEGGQTTNPSCDSSGKPVFYITSKNLAVSGGSYQKLDGGNSETCYLTLSK